MEFQRDQKSYRFFHGLWWFISYLVSGRQKAMLKASDNFRASGWLNTACYLSKRGANKFKDNNFWFNHILATSLQHLGKYEESNQLFENLLRKQETNINISYVLQHYGKSCVEQGKYDKAEAMFERALQLRVGNVKLTTSTQNALEELSRLTK